MSGRSAHSKYHQVKGSGSRSYRVTINYETGHFCECRGMISMKSKYGEDAGRTQGTSCKHIKNTIRDEYGGDWGTKNPDGSRTPNGHQNSAPSPAPSVPAQPTGRRAAIMATRAKREAERSEKAAATGGSLQDRIAALEAARSG